MIRRFSGLIAVTLGGLALRLLAINAWPLWTDEALTLIIAQWPLHTLFLAPADPTPGLYYGLHQLLVGPFASVAGARAISVVAGTLLIPASYWLAKEARGPKLLTATLVALSFPLIDYSQEARAYSLLVLLVTLSAGALLAWTRSGRRAHIAGAIVLAILAFYTHFTAVFWLGPMALVILWIGTRQAVPWLLGIVVAATPELFRLARYYPGGFAWLLQASPQQALETLARSLFPFRPNGVWALGAALLVGWRVWIKRAALRDWSRENRPAAAVLLIFLTMPAAIWLFGLLFAPIYMPRTILIAVPGFLLALALLLSVEHRAVSVLAVSLYAASLLATGTIRPREDWRAVSRQVGGDTVLLCDIGEAAALKHALQGEARVLMAFGDGVLSIEGSPWQRAYFRTLTVEAEKARAAVRGQGIRRGLYPVWTVRAGSGGRLAGAPTRLDQALRLCDADHARRTARYHSN